MARHLDIDQLAINTIRTLVIDAIQKSQSGHPGTPIDAAPTAYTLWQRFLRYDPDHPSWMNRDRFVLSSGHASMLLYSLIHLAGIKAVSQSYEKLGGEAVTLDDIKTFRQAGSRCPGHPEYGSGHLRLANLCWIYDSNRVTIEGHTDITFTEDVAARFLGYGWNVTRVTDPNDPEMLVRGYQNFLDNNDTPTLIIVHSHIGYGAPHKQDTAAAHGEPLGDEEARLTKEFFGFSPDEFFVVPDGVREHFKANLGKRGAHLRKEWDQLFERYRAQYPDLGDQVGRMLMGHRRRGGPGPEHQNPAHL
ncbi:MAG: hypothetical protein P8X58_06210 [Syntrophobacterales bacterium]